MSHDNPTVEGARNDLQMAAEATSEARNALDEGGDPQHLLNQVREIETAAEDLQNRVERILNGTNSTMGDSYNAGLRDLVHASDEAYDEIQQADEAIVHALDLLEEIESQDAGTAAGTVNIDGEVYDVTLSPASTAAEQGGAAAVLSLPMHEDIEAMQAILERAYEPIQNEYELVEDPETEHEQQVSQIGSLIQELQAQLNAYSE